MSLPDHRRAIHGRTHDRAWRATDYAPLVRPRQSRIADVVAAVAVGVMLAALLWIGL